jgi:hypothetical protein
LKKKSASARAFTKNFCGEKVNSLSFNGDTSVGRCGTEFFFSTGGGGKGGKQSFGRQISLDFFVVG